MVTTRRTGVLVEGLRQYASYNVPLYVVGLTQESCVSEYQDWCEKFKNQVLILSLNDVQEAMSQVMQKRFMEMFPSVPMSQLPPHNVWTQMAKVCGGTLMWYKIIFHSLENHINEMQDSFTWKPIVFVAPSMQVSKFKECIWKLQANSNVKIFYPGKLPTQQDLDDEMPFGIHCGWTDAIIEKDSRFEDVFQECFAPFILQNLERSSKLQGTCFKDKPSESSSIEI